MEDAGGAQVLEQSGSGRGGKDKGEFRECYPQRRLSDQCMRLSLCRRHVFPVIKESEIVSPAASSRMKF